MEDFYAFLYRYFESEIKEGKTEFRLVATRVHDKESIDLMIHPMGKDGKTIDLNLSVETYKSFHLGRK